MPDFRAYIRQNLPPLDVGGAREAEIIDELAQQLEDCYSLALSRGASEDDACEAARRQIPSWPRLARDLRGGRRHLLADGGHDLRFGIRLLLKHRGFTATAVATLALAIGLNTALFSILHAVLFESLPFPDPHRIVTLWENNSKDGVERDDVSPANFLDWRERNAVFEQVATSNPYSFDHTGEGDPEKFYAALVSSGFFTVLKVNPVHGRVFQDEDYERGRGRVVVLTHGLWQRRFGGDPSVVGRSLTLSGASYTVVGVLPKDFIVRLDRPERELFAPQLENPAWRQQRRATYLKVIARLKPGVSLAESQAAMTSIAQRLAAEYPRENSGIGVSVVQLREHLSGRLRPVLLILMAAAGLVLLIACANVANVLLVRGIERRREWTVRIMLGATAGRLVRQLLIESAILAVCGCAAGILLANWSVAFTLTLAPQELLREVRLHPTVLAFSAGVTIATAFIVGLVPALWLVRSGLDNRLGQAGSRSSGGVAAVRARGILVVTEVALAVVLLVSAGLLLRSFDHINRVQPGYSTERILVLQQYAWRLYDTPEKRLAYGRQVLDGILQVSGVRDAAISLSVPLVRDNAGTSYPVVTESRTAAAGSESTAYYNVVSQGYFTTMGIPLVRGRGFSDADGEGGERVAIVNEAMARRFWPDGDPVDRPMAVHFRQSPVKFRVIGVVASIRQRSFLDQPRPEFYQPFAQNPLGSMTFVVRTDPDSAGLLASVKSAIWKVDRSMLFYYTATIEGLVSE
ncbi:MAG: ABC transporter permease, partial [Bryobacteraceae bacterium]